MMIFKVALVITFVLVCAECKIILRNATGRVDFSTAGQCTNAAGSMSWEIPLNNMEQAYVQFHEVVVSCSEAKLIISRGGSNDPYCGPDKPGILIFNEHVVIFLQKFTKKCIVAKISFVYFHIGFGLETAATHVPTKQNVKFVAKLTGASSLNLECRISFGSSGETNLSTTTFTAERSFEYPGNYLVGARCGIIGSKEDFKTQFLDLYVESALSAEKLKMFHKQWSNTYPNPDEFVFYHKYYFPVSYTFMVDDVIISPHQTQETFNKTKFLSNGTEKVKFELNSKAQKLVGPGIHNVTLLLQNNVSSVTYATPITFDEEIKSFNIMTKQYVGLRPNFFVISATVSQGAPVDLSVEIKSTRTNLPVWKTSKFCPSDCLLMAIEATVSQPGIYKVVATAKNNNSSLTSSRSFEALPQIYDVYITSRRLDFSDYYRDVYVFVRGDLGDFVMNLTIEDSSQIVNLAISKSEYEHKDLPNLPFDAKPYKLVKQRSLFFEAGSKPVTVVIANTKQSFRFVGSVPMSFTYSCLHSVRIRDGKVGGGLDEPLKFVEEFVLNADLIFNCVRNAFFLDYKWRVYRVTSKIDIPKTGDEVQLQANSVQPELVVTPDALLPGLYVINIAVNLTSYHTFSVITKVNGYALIEIPTRKLNFIIKGGNVVEAGTNTTVLRFEASIDFNKYDKNINRDWFCAVTEKDLPLNAKIGKIQRKGSCFDWHTLWVTGDDVMEISMSKLIRSENYYVRLIVSGEHYDAAFADQKIIFTSKPVPVVSLRCWLNCGKLFSPHLPIILQIVCDNCSRHSWVLSLKSGRQLHLCQNRRFCKLGRSLLNVIDTSSNVTGTAYTIDGEKASVTLFLTPPSSPSGVGCRATPDIGIAEVTKFNMTCTSFGKDQTSLKYSFFVKERDQKFLLQHGYDSSVNDVILTSEQLPSFVTIVVQICGSRLSCYERNFSIFLTENHQGGNKLKAGFFNAFWSNDLQKIAKCTLPVPISPTKILTESEKRKIFEEVGKYPLVTLDSVKQVADVLSHLTKDFDVMSLKLQKVVRIMDRTEGFALKLKREGDDDIIRSIAASSLTVTSNLIEASKETSFKIKETSRMTRLGRALMTSLVPGEEAVTFETKFIKGRFLKLNNDVINPLGGNSSLVRLPNIQALSDEVINVEIFTYNTSSVDFSTNKHKVDLVTSVTLATGWENQIPISYVEAENQTVGFDLPAQPSKENIVTRVQSNCDVTHCHSKATGSALLDLATQRRRTSHSIIRIHVENMDLKIQNCKLSLETTNKSPFKLNKTFHEKESSYSWLVPVKSLPVAENEFNLTIQVDLGEGYYRKGSLIDLTYSSFMLECLHWDVDAKDWSENSCKVHQNIETGLVDCECDLTQDTNDNKRRKREKKIAPTLYASTLVVLPNKIDQSQLSWNLWEHFQDNPVIISFLFVLYSIYALLLVWARNKDKDAEKKGLFIEVEDNSPDDQHRYYVTIYTGSRLHGGTTAAVCMRLLGKRKTSNAHVIQRENGNILTTGSVQSFLVTTPQSLGDVRAVKMWRNDGGSSPKWYLERMVVRDLETSACWFFMCGKWFSEVDVEYTFPVATIDQLQISTNLFLMKLENHFKDRHVWYSVFGMRPWQHEVMTRVERVSTCSLFIFMVMLTSMMFHGHSYALDGNVLTVGHYYFKWSHIVVGIESALMCFPGPYFISLMFRHAKRRKMNKNSNPDNNPQSTQTTRGQQEPTTSLARSHDVKNTRKSPEKKSIKVDQNRKKNGQHISDDKDRPSTSKDISNLVHGQRQTFPGKVKIENETKQQNNRRNLRDSTMNKKFTTSRGEREVATTSYPVKLMTSSKMKKHIPSRVERNGAGTSSSVKPVTSTKVKKNIPSRVDRDGANKSSPAKHVTSSKIIKHMPSRVERKVTTNSSRVKPVTSSKVKKHIPSRVERKVTTTASPVKPMMSKVKKHKPLQVKRDVAKTSSPATKMTSSEMRPSARPPLTATEAQQELTIAEIDPNTLDPLAIVHFSIYVAWFYIFAVMIASTVICVMYGMTYGLETCRDWLVSFVSAFIETVIILESLKVVLIAYFSVINNPIHDLRDWIPPLPPSVRPRSYVKRGATAKKQKKEKLTNPIYRAPTRERTNRKRNTQEDIEMQIIKKRVSP
ncbi:polycystin family receptor for egg jelly-like isoform X1 [Clavelina lepadiformis]|uniref:polycystin family receptor for egg jelly-like isoform X1 n=1 Tax=Clavelina lepadiformis TaxID=159417 RepID=UPI0040411A5D